MIAITGVTGKLGGRVAEVLSERGINTVHIARNPMKAKKYSNAEIRKVSYENSEESRSALTGVKTLLMVSAKENAKRVEEHIGFIDAAKTAGEGLVSAVARKDASDMVVAVMLNTEEYKNKVLNLTGPRNLSMKEITKIVSEKTGKEITYYDETVEEAYKSRQKWEAEQWEYDSWVSTYTAIEKGEQEGVSLDIEKVLGRPATSIEQVLEEYTV